MAEGQVPAAQASTIAEVTPAAALVVEDNNVGSANPQGAGERSAPLMVRPDWVPEKFFKDGVIDYKGIATENAYLSKKGSEPKVTEPKAGETQVKEGEPKVVETPKVDAPVITVPGVAAERVTAFTAEIAEKGVLSSASYAELAALGYGKATVDVYLAGLTRDAAVTQAVDAAQVAKVEIDSIITGIGGQDQLKEMISWAKANLSAADLKVYNDSVSSKDPAKVRMAVNGLHHTFTELHGKDPQYLEGQRLPLNPQGLQPYANEDEVTKDMSTREYKNSEEFRQKVAARLRVSPDVFTRSRDTSKVQR